MSRLLGDRLESGSARGRSIVCSALAAGVMMGVIVLPAMKALSQIVPRPSDSAPNVAPFDPEEPTTELSVPQADLPEDSTMEPPKGLLKVRVDQILIRGATAFTPTDFERVTSGYLSRDLTTADLVQLTSVVSAMYRDAGYATSRAVLPDQDMRDGRLVLRIIEGSLEGVVVEGNRTFRRQYFESRIALASEGVLNVNRLVERLAVMQQNPLIERVDAILASTGEIGRHRLHLEIVERAPYDLTLFASNDQAESVGSRGGGFQASWANTLGVDDELQVSGRFTEGIREFVVGMRLPLNRWDSQLLASFDWNETDVVEPSLSALDIESESQQIRFELRHPFLRTRDLDIWASVIGDWTRTRGSIFGEAFCFRRDVPDCRPTASVVRLRQEVQWRDRNTAVSLRSTLNIGVDVLSATGERSNGMADGEFVSWLAQIRGMRRVALERRSSGWLRDSILVFRGDVQLTNEPLLSSERIAVGGAESVRGYRRNQLVKDNALIGSAELRVPVWSGPFGEPILTLAPFYDIGHAWNDRGPNQLRTLSSLGVEARIVPGLGFAGTLSWAHRLRNGVLDAKDLQGQGIYFEVIWNVF